MSTRISTTSGQPLNPQSTQSKQGTEENSEKSAVAGRPRANVVLSGPKVGRLLTDKTAATSVSTSIPAVTSAPQFTSPQPQHGIPQAKTAPSSSSSSSSTSSGAQSTPLRNGMNVPDFSQTGTAEILEKAASEGDIRDLASMIEQDAAKNVSPWSKSVLMHRLVGDKSLGRDRRLALVQTLLDAGVKAQDGYRGTPYIVSAANSSNADLVTLLVESGADINAKDDSGNTALMIAAQTKDDQTGQMMIMCLMDKKPHVNAINGAKQSALLLAAANGKTKCLQTLLHANPKLDQKDNQHQGLLINAVQSGNVETAQAVIQLGVKLDQRDVNGNSALFHAVLKNDTAMVNLLIKSGANVHKPNKKGETPLFFACRGGYSEEVIVALLQAGADPYKADKKGRKPIEFIKSEDQSHYVELFKTYKGKDAGKAKFSHAFAVGKKKSAEDPQAPLFNAIASNDVNNVHTCVVQYGFDMATPNQHGETALGYACKLGCSDEIIYCLLGAHADPNQPDSHGKLPLSYARPDRHARYVDIFNNPY